jgi:chemotaxis protein MotA
MDLASVIGTLLALVAVVGGQILEGGTLGQITQLTALLIVVGGTLGATLLSFPGADIRRAIGFFPQVYFRSDPDLTPLVEDIFRIATLVRKEGLLIIEQQKDSIRDPMLKRTLKFVVDGFEPQTVREIIDTEIEQTYDEEEQAARVFEAAGGYAPTIGILGAVLGLIQVLSKLNDPSKIGEGIAVAFVATIYGVSFANLLLIPWGQKLKRNAQVRRIAKEAVKQGVVGIQEGVNPHFLKEKLTAFLKQNMKTAVKV